MKLFNMLFPCDFYLTSLINYKPRLELVPYFLFLKMESWHEYYYMHTIT